MGFCVALDDYLFDDPREVMLDCVDLIKVNLPLVGGKLLEKLVRAASRTPSCRWPPIEAD